jgi:uncharacterized protein YndB with AHSA1/START domain
MGAAEKLATEGRELVQQRVFDAPRERVWRAWTEAKHLDQWWGPNGFRNETHAMQFKVGGTWRYTMHGPDGKAWPNWIRYGEIVKGERLVYDHGGEGVDPHFHVAITFESMGAKTRVTMKSLFPSVEAVEAVKKFGAVEGGKQTLARLAGHLPWFDEAEGAMVLSRLYDFPREQVFAAWTSAAALERWWGPKGMTTRVPQLEFAVGGKYRMVMVDPRAGAEYPFHGTFTEIVPHERIVFDSLIEHAPAGVTVTTTVTFTDDNGKTLMTVRQTRPSDPMMAKGQTEGWSGQLEKLDAMLGS